MSKKNPPLPQQGEIWVNKNDNSTIHIRSVGLSDSLVSFGYSDSGRPSSYIMPLNELYKDYKREYVNPLEQLEEAFASMREDF